jgi:glyoxylase-like metal-dependent hydrolase (beta-lactamase superfamily II)
MSTIKLLVKGYAKKVNNQEYASSGVTLIRDSGLNILVDTGMDRKKLMLALKKEKLMPDDINYVVITHTHLDHCLLAGIFTKSKIIDDNSIYSFDGKIVEHNKTIPKTKIKIISTPGHDQFHYGVLVETKEYGMVALTADLFWWPDNKKQLTDYKSLLNLNDQYLKDKKALVKSREKILKITNYIIPGHGDPFFFKK